MRVQLPPELIPFVEEVIASGRFSSAKEVVEYALRSQREQQLADDEANARVRKRIEDFSRGDHIEISDETSSRTLDAVGEEADIDLEARRASYRQLQLEVRERIASVDRGEGIMLDSAGMKALIQEIKNR